MDGRSSRTSRQVDRRVVNSANAPSPSYRQPDTSTAYADEPPVQPPARPQSPYTPQPTRKRSKLPKWILPAGIVLVLGGIVAAVFLLMPTTRTAASEIDSSKYQAVFFTNGQVYFGKLEVINDNYLKLKDIYYLQTEDTTQQTSQNPQETTTDASNVQLIKLGEEVHGPEDAMTIARDQMLFFENLKDDGKVGQTIKQHKQNNQ